MNIEVKFLSLQIKDITISTTQKKNNFCYFLQDEKVLSFQEEFLPQTKFAMGTTDFMM